MKYFYLILSLTFFQLQAQKNKEVRWIPGQVHFANGKVESHELRYSVSTSEGSLHLKSLESQTTFSPRQVMKFSFYDSAFLRHREFYSVPTELRKKTGGQKSIFLELLYQGEEYSLFRRFFPTKKFRADVFIVMGLSGFQYWWKGDLEPSLFIHIHGEKAYQITEGIANDEKAKQGISIDEELSYNLDFKMIKPAMGDDWNKMKKFCKQNNLGIRHEAGWIEGLKFLNGSEFTYNKRDVPKRLRKK